MTRALLLLGIAFFLGGYLPSRAADAAAPADGLQVKGGSIYLSAGNGMRVRLTSGGQDSDPALSPDKRWIVFVRATPGKMISTGSGDVEATEVWLAQADGKNPKLLLQGATHEKPEQLLAGFQSPQFSPDGKTIFFLGSAWATSGAVHAIDAATKKVRFICPGNSLEVVPAGEYRGCLIVQQHRYFLGGGSYDWHWLLRADGKEVGPIGETTENFKDTYGPDSGR